MGIVIGCIMLTNSLADASAAVVYFTDLAALGFGTTVVPGIALADPAHNGIYKLYYCPYNRSGSRIPFRISAWNRV